MRNLGIGYDYGTTTSYLSICDVNTHKTKLVADSYGNKRFPSAVFVHEDGTMIFGEDAWIHRSENQRFYSSLKPMIKEFSNHESYYSFVGCALKEYTKWMFKHLKTELEDVDEAYLTVTTPLGFTFRENKIMTDTVSECFRSLYPDIDVKGVSFLPEPIAATVFIISSSQSYSLQNTGYLAVCDMGGGTTDLTIVEYNRSNLLRPIISVKQTQHNMNLGGDLITEKFMDYINQRFGLQYSFDDVDNIKKSLSTYSCKRIGDDLIVSRENLNEVLRSNNIINKLENMMRILTENFDDDNVHIAPVGGSSRIQLIQETYKSLNHRDTLDLFGEKKEESFDSVVRGAAMYSSYNLSDACCVELHGRTSLPLSVQCDNGSLYECVLSNSEDDVFKNDVFHPREVLGDGSIVLGNFFFYQVAKENRDVIHDRHPDFQFALNEPIFTGKTNANDITIGISIVIRASVFSSCTVTVTTKDDNGNDIIHFERTIQVEDMIKL